MRAYLTERLIEYGALAVVLAVAWVVAVPVFDADPASVKAILGSVAVVYVWHNWYERQRGRP